MLDTNPRRSPLYLVLRAACALAFVGALAACGQGSDPSPSGNCEQTGTCGGPTVKPDGGTGEPDGGGPDGGQWPSGDFMDYTATYNVLPRGTFVIRTLDQKSELIVAKNGDDSLIVAEPRVRPGDPIDGTVSRWRIWHGEMFYQVENALVGPKNNEAYQFITGSLRTPGGSVTSPKTLELSTPYGQPTRASVSTLSPLIGGALHYMSFLSNPFRDDATFEKNDVVAGIPCKKYTHTLFNSTNEWWILENGFCLKHTSTISGGGVSGFEVIQAELDTPNYDYVTQKYARFEKQAGAIPPVAGMLRVAEAVSGGQWVDPSDSNYLAWTAGGIELMAVFREMHTAGNPVHQIYFSLSSGDVAAALGDYRARILQIPGMKLIDSLESEVGSYWEYNNRDASSCDSGGRYYAYKVTSMGTMNEVIARYIALVCV